MNWVNVLAIVCFVLGLVSGTSGLKSLRSREPAQAEIGWQQPPLSPWKYETLTMFVITLHTLGLVCLAAFVGLSVTRSGLVDASPNLIASLLLSLPGLIAVFFTAYSSGVAVAYHFAQPWIRPVSYGIRGAGMLYGGILVSWKSYSHYEIGPEDGLISLYSSYSPPLRTWVLKPPAELFTRVLGLIQKNLPSSPRVDGSISWQRSPLVLILEMAVLVVGALLVIAWGWLRSPSFVWIYALIAFFLVQYVGIKLMTLFDGRGQTSSTESTE